MASLAKYGYLKASASIIRLGFRYSGSTPQPKPDEVLEIPSRDENRSIKTHVYNPAKNSTSRSTPVVVNFHGSGWILPAHGENDHYCRTITQNTDYKVLDVSYRLAPETPFPGAQNDCEDVLNYILANPDLYDSNRIVLSGFSAGGHTALVLASSVFPAKTFSKIILFYPPIDLTIVPSSRPSPDPDMGPLVPPKLLDLLQACYLQDASLDKKDHRISPAFAPLDGLPNEIAIFTAGADSLMPEVEVFVERLRTESDLSLTYRRFEKCSHAFDVSPKSGSVAEKAQKEAYSIVVTMLQR
ncbi:related to esterase/lipase [Ramularia collo-cygni]|uniref:Related to esterase/lipase n=1 Tax=Ramularia collo-cygni TaxID=112498 RepID=A0A2D3USS7_9PEZI|nr:related to esterase/lipase [Ramularia collo-cygni]CZT16875.1 related to esterase/lipase [Ramularia collo-cygni]